MRTYWVPGVNNLGSYGRWAFAEFTEVWDMEEKFGELVESFLGAAGAK
jgi:type III restriction enzyme